MRNVKSLKFKKKFSLLYIKSDGKDIYDHKRSSTALL